MPCAKPSSKSGNSTRCASLLRAKVASVWPMLRWGCGGRGASPTKTTQASTVIGMSAMMVQPMA